MRSGLICIGLFVIGSAHSADYYKCAQPDGSTRFSEEPCGNDAKIISVKGPEKKLVATQVWCREAEAPTEKLVADCVDKWRPSLRNPKAAYSESAKLGFLSVSKERMLVVEARAQNGFGGMNAMQMKCSVTSHGDIDAAGTAKQLDLQKAFDELKVTPTPITFESCPDQSQ